MIDCVCGEMAIGISRVEPYLYKAKCTACGRVSYGKDSWKAARAWDADTREWSKNIKRSISPSNASKVVQGITSPPPVVEAVRRGRSTVDSVAKSLRIEPAEAAVKISEASKTYPIKKNHNTLSLEPNYQDRALYVPWDAGRELRAICPGDTHAGHRGFEAQRFTEFIHCGYEEHGCRVVFGTGDNVDGLKHEGQSYEQRRSRIHDQIIELLDAMPQLPGLKYLMINGNHDEWYFKAGHMEVTSMMNLIAGANGRDDIVPLGTEKARVQFGSGDDAIRVMLSHARGKNAVTKTQGPDRPDLFIQGHFHDVAVKKYGGIFYLRPGGWQTTSRFFNSMGGAPDICGSILSIRKSGGLAKFTHTIKEYPREHSVWISPDEAAELEANGIGWE